VTGPDVRNVKINVTVDSDTRGAREASVALEGVDKSADKAGKSLHGMGDESKRLDSQIAQTRARIRELSAEFARTGDKSLFGDLRKERSLLSQLNRVAKEIQPVAAKGLLQSLDFSEMVAESRGILVAGGVALGLAMAPGLAGVVSSAVLGAVGAGGVVGGAVLAAQDTRVQKAWADLGHSILDKFEPAGAAFVQPMIHAADLLEGAFDRSGIVDTLKDASVLVEPLTQSLGGFLEELGPGLDSAIKGSLPTWRMFSKELPEFGASISDLLDSMAQAGPEASVAMKDLFDVLEDANRSAGPAIEGLTKVYALTRGLNQSTKDLTGASVFGDIIPTFGLLEVLGKVMGGDVVPTLSTVAQGTEEVRKAQEDASKAVEDMVDAMRKENAEFEHSIDLQAAYKLDILDVEDGLQNLANTLDENGTSLSQFTEEGRDNQRAIIGVAKEMRQLRDDTIAMGGSTESANATLAANKQRLIEQATAAGVSEAAVRNLIDALFAVPSVDASVVVRTFNPNTGLEGRRAAGGPVNPFGTYLVGEKGPELLRMGSQGGFVSPNGAGMPNLSLTVNLVDASGQVTRRILIDDALSRGVQQSTISAAYP